MDVTTLDDDRITRLQNDYDSRIRLLVDMIEKMSVQIVRLESKVSDLEQRIAEDDLK